MWKNNYTLKILLSSQATLELVNQYRDTAPCNIQRNFVGFERTNQKLRYLKETTSVTIGFLCYDREAGDFQFEVNLGRNYRFSSAKHHDLMKTHILFSDWNFLIDEPALNQAHWRSEHTNQLNIVWLADHHHAFQHAIEIPRRVDFFCHAHPSHTDYLNSFLSNNLGLLHCAALQWKESDLDEFLPGFLKAERSNNLYGGFTAYSEFPRNGFISDCIEKLPDNELFLTPHSGVPSGLYFGLDNLARLKSWCSYKTSLAVPVNRDISPRIFDALLAGQIPIVADDVTGLDIAISPQNQLRLGVTKYRANDVESVASAHLRAIAKFDQLGQDGILARSRYARENHTFVQRLSRLAELIEVAIVNA